MADRLNIQSAVLRVVENMHSLNRHQPAPPGPSNSAVSATVTDELNRSLQIPRRSRPRDSSTMNENESGIHLAKKVRVPPSFQNLATGLSSSQNYSIVGKLLVSSPTNVYLIFKEETMPLKTDGFGKNLCGKELA